MHQNKIKQSSNTLFSIVKQKEQSATIHVWHESILKHDTIQCKSTYLEKNVFDIRPKNWTLIKKCEQGRKNKMTRPQPSIIMAITIWKFGNKRYN